MGGEALTQPSSTGPAPTGAATAGVEMTGSPTPPIPSPKPKRFHATVKLDSSRIGRDAGRIAEEIIQHLTVLPDSTVEVIMEIQAEVPSGVPENVVRTVTENCRTLKFTNQGFERE